MKDPNIFLHHILESIAAIENYTQDVTESTFREYAQQETQDAVMRRIEIIGEAVKNLPEDFREQHSQIPWKKATGMRDKLIHGYFGVDLELVWDVVVNDLPTFKEQITKLLTELSQ